MSKYPKILVLTNSREEFLIVKDSIRYPWKFDIKQTLRLEQLRGVDINTFIIAYNPERWSHELRGDWTITFDEFIKSRGFTNLHFAKNFVEVQDLDEKINNLLS